MKGRGGGRIVVRIMWGEGWRECRCGRILWGEGWREHRRWRIMWECQRRRIMWGEGWQERQRGRIMWGLNIGVRNVCELRLFAQRNATQEKGLCQDSLPAEKCCRDVFLTVSLWHVPTCRSTFFCRYLDWVSAIRPTPGRHVTTAQKLYTNHRRWLQHLIHQ